MATADFKCPDCDTVREVTYTLEKGPPKTVRCTCKHKMERVWDVAINIPEWTNDDTFTSISQRIQHASRPTGRGKIFF